MNKTCGRQVIRIVSPAGQRLAAEPVVVTLAVQAHAAAVVRTTVTTSGALSRPSPFLSRSAISNRFRQVGCVAGVYSAARSVQSGNFDTARASGIYCIYR